MPRLFPIITDVASVLELFTVVPVLVTAYTCHYNGTLDDVLANFDTDLGIPFGSVLNDAASCACISSCLLCSARQPR
ncbi:hypothetical protein AAZV13_11G056000 [Glycine max]|uniref:amino acid transporter AVT6B-like n=1 Tax=Glycine soja TaxID=3848 RepID=UPI00103E3A4E|nr:amino acid transporter AVT6B-like [Glycine soja]